MANFTALKTAINNAIKTNGNEEITGAILQAILDAMVETLGDSAINDLENAITTEVTNRENAVGGVADDLAAEVQARQALDYNVNNRINAEKYNRQNADAALSQTMNQGFQTLGSQMTALNAAISALNAAYQNGYLYGGIATPSSSPSNNKCFYIALQGGTYTNFGGVGVVEGINIIKNDSGWKVEHIYDQTTLLNEFYLLRQQVIQAITSFAPIVIEGDVTNAPDEEDLTSNANHLLQFKNNAYSPLEFSGLGRKYLRKNIAPLSESAPFNGFVEGVNAEETLSGTPTYIFWDRMNTRFVGIKDGVYYLDWTDSDNYVPVSTSLVYMYNGTPYQWTGSDFIVDETEVPNLVNCLTQDMINEANTIYIIRYDYTLKEDITIPANCVLEFDGGSISGGNIANIGKIVNKGNTTIFHNITFTNPLKQEVFLIWFDNNNSVGDSLMEAAKFQIVNAIGDWILDKQVNIHNNIELFNGNFACRAGQDVYNIYVESEDVSEEKSYDSTIAAGSSSINTGVQGNYTLCLLKASDIWYKNSARNSKVGELMPIKELTTTTTDFGRYKTVCAYTQDIKVQYFNPIKVNIHDCKFTANYEWDNDYLGVLLKTIKCEGTINNCYFEGCSQGISCEDGYNVNIYSCTFNGTYPWACAFVGATAFSILNNSIFRCHRHAWSTLGETYVVKFCTISNCLVSESLYPIMSHSGAFGILIEGNHICNCAGGVGSMSPNTTIKSNVIENGSDYLNTTSTVGIYALEAGAINLTICENTIKQKVHQGNAIEISGDINADYYITPEYITISKNIINGISKGRGIEVSPRFKNRTNPEADNAGYPIINIIDNFISDTKLMAIRCDGRQVFIVDNTITFVRDSNYPAIEIDLPPNGLRNYSSALIRGNCIYSNSYSEGAVIVNNFLTCYLSNNQLVNVTTNYKFTNVSYKGGDVPTSVPPVPIRGDMCFVSGKPQWYNGTAWVDGTGAPV